MLHIEYNTNDKKKRYDQKHERTHNFPYDSECYSYWEL